MRRLGFPLLLVFLSLFAATVFTTVTAATLASYAKKENNSQNAVAKKAVVANTSLAAIR
jgi:hypothetical protein